MKTKILYDPVSDTWVFKRKKHKSEYSEIYKDGPISRYITIDEIKKIFRRAVYIGEL